jgi:hypothetical protein
MGLETRFEIVTCFVFVWFDRHSNPRTPMIQCYHLSSLQPTFRADQLITLPFFWFFWLFLFVFFALVIFLLCFFVLLSHVEISPRLCSTSQRSQMQKLYELGSVQSQMQSSSTTYDVTPKQPDPKCFLHQSNQAKREPLRYHAKKTDAMQRGYKACRIACMCFSCVFLDFQ